uniref:Uncharacterized protein n=1 Tax=Setaria italica TaxID=4555 RepID=K4A2Y1_SETIT
MFFKEPVAIPERCRLPYLPREAGATSHGRSETPHLITISPSIGVTASSNTISSPTHVPHSCSPADAMKQFVSPSTPTSSSTPSRCLSPTGSPLCIERSSGTSSSMSCSHSTVGHHFLVALLRYIEAAQSSCYDGASALGSHSDAADLNPPSPADGCHRAAKGNSTCSQPPPAVGPASSTPAPSSPHKKLTLTMDSSDDRPRGYCTPFPRDDALCIFHHADNTFTCLVKDHVLGMATSASLRGENKKKWSHHHVVAWNEGMVT